MIVNTFDIKKGIYHFTENDLSTQIHKHHAIEIILAKNGSFDISTPMGCLEKLRFALIPPNILHGLKFENSEIEIFMFDVNKLVSQTVLVIFENQIPQNGIYVFDENFEKNIIEKVLQIIDYQIFKLDIRVLESIGFIEKNCSESTLTLQRIAKEIHLSPSRLSHLFKEQMNISIQKYIIWTRLKTSIHNVINHEKDLTTVSLQAGFYDLAHFSKHFKSFFGIAPSFPYQK